MGQVKVSVTCYQSKMPDPRSAIIKLDSGNKTKTLYFEFSQTVLGILDFEIITKSIDEASLPMYYRISLVDLRKDLASAYRISKLIESPVLKNKLLMKWLKNLGVLGIKTNDPIMHCTVCEEKPLTKKHSKIVLKQIREEIARGIDLKEVGYSMDLEYCERCIREEVAEDYLETEDIVTLLENEYYQNHTTIRRQLFSHYSYAYSSEDDLTGEMISLLIDEIYYNRVVKKDAEELLVKLFEFHDYLEEKEVDAIVLNFEKIIAILQRDGMKLRGGIREMLHSLMMNQHHFIEQYLDRLLEIFVKDDYIRDCSTYFPLLVRKYPEKFVPHIDKIEKLGIEDVDFRIVLAGLSTKYPELVTPYLDSLLSTFTQKDGDIYYTAMVLEQLSDAYPESLVDLYSALIEIRKRQGKFDGYELLDTCIENIAGIMEENR